MNEPSFIKVFKKEWVQLTGLPFHMKVVKMREPLRKWNREVFGHIDQKIKSFQKEMAKLDLKAQEFMLDEVEWHRRDALQSLLWLWQTRKERYWKQLLRCKIIKEGDRNTKYFHVLATIRRRKKMISSLTRGTEVINDQTEIKRTIIQHFKQLYARQEATMFDISTLGLNKITHEECNTLEEQVTPMEVREAMLSCGPLKALGYDGFNLKCIRHVWPIIGEECSRYVIQFFKTGILPQCINTTWVTLVPKK